MTALHIYTARITYAGPDRVDVTRTRGEGWLAPSYELLRADKHGDMKWDLYRLKFLNEMAASRVRWPERWAALVQRDQLTLCCFCPAGAPCHRLLLAQIVLPQVCREHDIGCVYMGERPEGRQLGLFDA